MTNQHNRSSHVLFLGLDHAFAEQLAVWLALEGVRLIALGNSGDRLTRVKREIRAFGGMFDYLNANLNHSQTLETCLESLIYQFDGIDCIINLVDERQPQPSLYPPPMDMQQSNLSVVKTYRSILSQYRDIRVLRRVVNVVLVSHTPHEQQSAVFEDGIAFDYLYLVDSSNLKTNHISLHHGLCAVPLEWAGRTVLQRLDCERDCVTQRIELVEGEGLLYDSNVAQSAPVRLGNAPSLVTSNDGVVSLLGGRSVEI